ncbi:GtrA family protein [Ferruginibacter sp. SUN106]|uniref:GtrA family protein n=1 Tax=Ferruginibacter sp. SUN106 TaxID=2978348 RepID=UPI003D367D8D
MKTMVDAHLLKFGIVGIGGMVIDFGVTWLCKEKIKLNKYLSNSLGFCCAVINNFLLNRYWTFESTGHPFASQLAIFILVSLTGLLINNGMLYFLSKYIKTNFYLIKLIVTGLVFSWNYFINFLFTFN